MSNARRRGRLLIIGSLLACSTLAFAAGVGSFYVRNAFLSDKQTGPVQVFWEAWDHVEGEFYGAVPSARERTYGAIHRSIALLGDPYTVFLEPREHELERDRMQGKYGGIGTTPSRSPEGEIVLYPSPGSPAARAGVEEGDVVVAIDGLRVAAATSLEDITAQFHGEIGTTVILTVLRPPDSQFDIGIVREAIHTPSVQWRALDHPARAGYLRIDSFTGRTEEEVGTALKELQEAALDGLVLDLRDNAGGFIDSAAGIASQFIAAGQVVLYEVYRDAAEETVLAEPGGLALDLPLVVLVNGATASAAEILAAALQDHGRALLIGEPTYGKGSVQLVFDLPDGSSLHVTTAVWLSPSRHQIEGEGLEPDMISPPGEDSHDTAMEMATEYLQSYPRGDGVQSG